jgi:hypothetical protein
MTTPAVDRSVFSRALEKSQATLNQNDKDNFQFTTLDDLQDTIARIQRNQASEKKMRNLTRLKSFLEAMDQYGKVIEIYLNPSIFIAVVWVSSAL